MYAPITKLGRAQRQVAYPYNVPAPTGGLNARDAYTDMDPKDAVGLTNVFPEANYVAVRKGFAPSTTGLNSQVNTLLVWNGLTGRDKIFGAAGSAIWDANNATGTAVVTGLSNSKWQWTNLENAGGMFLIAVNGVDQPLNYDGTTWTRPPITGVNPASFVNVCQFKERLWFAQINSLNLWYLDTQAIQGTANPFPLGSVFRRGGYIIALGSFSQDAGEGPDDYFVIATNNGEVAVYQGTDPTSATTWSLVGLFSIGKPIGRRCMARLSGDLAIVTQDGIESMQAALQFDRSAAQKATITGKIQTLFSQYSRAYFSNFGWQPQVYPRARYLIVNVPQLTGMTQIQLVMNTITGAYCQFKNMDANCWGVANDQLYFGGNYGTIYQADNGNLDQVTGPLTFLNNVGGPIRWTNSAGGPITFTADSFGAIQWEVQTSWQAWGGKNNKQFTATRPVMLTGGGITFAIGVDVDFVVTDPPGMLTTPVLSGAVWPMTWPWTWGGETSLNSRWQSVGAIGTYASVHIKGLVNGTPCQLNSMDLVAQRSQGTVY